MSVELEYSGEEAAPRGYCRWVFELLALPGDKAVQITCYGEKGSRMITARFIKGNNEVQWEEDDNWITPDAKDFIGRALKLKAFL